MESSRAVKVARIRTHEVEEWRRLTKQAGIGIDVVFHPESDRAERILRVLPTPGVSDIFSAARLAAADSLIALVFRGSEVVIPHGAVVLRSASRARMAYAGWPDSTFTTSSTPIPTPPCSFSRAISTRAMAGTQQSQRP